MKWIKSKSLRFLFVVFFFVTLILPLFNMFATITTESIQNLLFTPRTTLLTGITAAACIIIIGTGIGLAGGYFGGRLDKALQSLTAVGMTIPQLPFAIVFVAFMEPSMWNIVIAICVTAWPTTARLVRAKVLEVRQLPFVRGGYRFI